MADDARDPPDDDDDLSHEDDADDTEPDEPVEGDDLTAPLVAPAVVHRFLTTPKALRVAKNAVRRLVPRDEIENLVADALVRALKAPRPHTEIVLPGWLAAIARRTAMRWLTKRKRRAKYEGPMPSRVAREDDYTGKAADADDAPEPFYDPAADEEPAKLLGEELDRRIGDNVRDKEVREMIREASEEEKTYAQIAAERGLTPAQVANRILRFKVKYAARVKRDRQWAFFVKLAWGTAGAGALAAIFLALYLLRHRTEGIGRDPSLPERPSPSASASTPVFLQALPPPPEPSTAPSEAPHDKPRPPRR
jgi:DNA-directed RNA polymerase specialized sigma24 family protein